MCLDRLSIDRLQKFHYFSKRQIMPMRMVRQEIPLCTHRPFVIPHRRHPMGEPTDPESEGLSPMDMLQPEPSLRTAEVARALGVSPRAVRIWADDGKIACYRTFGGHRLFSVSEVRRVLMSWGRPGLAIAETQTGGLVPSGEPAGTPEDASVDGERGTVYG
jgi:excisionase family DNA binding protein